MNKYNNKEIYTEKDFISSTRVLTLMSSLLFLIFSVVDMWAVSSILTEALVVRGGIAVVLLFAYAMTFSRYFYPSKHIVMPGLIVLSSFAIEYIIYRASPSDQAYTIYFVGVVLILITLYSLTYIHSLIAHILSAIIILAYVCIEVFSRPIGLAPSITELLTNLFFIGAAVTIGIVARSIRNKYILENYQLQKSLTSALKEKTKESDDYAYQANHDALTLLPNRRYITALLEESLQIAKEKDKILAILFFDLNGFKQINDIYGHAVGDEVLVIVAKRLELAIRKGDHISRLGGDEYLVGLMMDKEHVSEVTSMAEKFTAIISEPMRIDGNIVKVGASVGIAAYPMHGNNINVLIDIADKKMYNIKQGIDKVAKKPEEADNSKAIVIFPGNSRKLQC